MELSPIEPERAVATVAVTENESPVRRVPAPAVAPLVSAPPVLAPNPIHIAPATSPKKIIAGPRVQKPVENSRGEDALPFGETLTARGGSLVLCEGSLSGVATKGSVGEISYGAER